PRHITAIHFDQLVSCEPFIFLLGFFFSFFLFRCQFLCFFLFHKFLGRCFFFSFFLRCQFLRFFLFRQLLSCRFFFGFFFSCQACFFLFFCSLDLGFFQGNALFFSFFFFLCFHLFTFDATRRIDFVCCKGDSNARTNYYCE